MTKKARAGASADAIGWATGILADDKGASEREIILAKGLLAEREARDKLGQALMHLVNQRTSQKCARKERQVLKLGVSETAWLFRKIVEAMEIGPSYRYFIYTMLGFDEAAYCPLLMAGGMTITNAIEPDEGGYEGAGELKAQRALRMANRRAARWEMLARRLHAERERMRYQLATTVDEAFGPQPVMTIEDLCAFIDRKLYERRAGK